MQREGRAEQNDRNRALLLAAARRVFLARGYYAATLEQIADVLPSGDLQPSDYAKLRPLFDKILEIHYPET